MTPAPKRRLSFSLRTLFVLVTVVGGLLGSAIGWQRHMAKAVDGRRHLLMWIEKNGGTVTMQPPSLTAGDQFLRFPYGDQATADIFLTEDLGESKIQQIVETFPEAAVRVHTAKDGRLIKRRIEAH